MTPLAVNSPAVVTTEPLAIIFDETNNPF